MHKIYINDDVTFKKRYCGCCGNVLEKKRTEKIVRKGDPAHFAYCNMGRSYHPYGDILVIGKEYFCPACNQFFSCDEQAYVRLAQKRYGKKIVSQKEIDETQHHLLLEDIQRILKSRWLLFVPLIGGIICFYFCSAGPFSGQKGVGKEVNRVFKSSLLLVLSFAIVYAIFANATNIPHSPLTMIAAGYVYNLPTLWYIIFRVKPASQKLRTQSLSDQFQNHSP